MTVEKAAGVRGFAPTEEPFLDVVPPSVSRNSNPPLRAAAKTFLAALDAAHLGATFWTGEAVAAARAAGVRGFAGEYPTSRAQILLWALGFRVIETRPERGGAVYRWRHNPGAPVRLSDVPDHVEARILKGAEAMRNRSVPALVEPEAAPAAPESAVEASEAAPAPQAAEDGVDWALAELVRIEADRDQWRQKAENAIAAHQDAVDAFQRVQRDLAARDAEILTLRRERDAARADLARATIDAERADDGDDSWSITAPPESTVRALVEQSHAFGIEIEIRARRA